MRQKTLSEYPIEKIIMPLPVISKQIHEVKGRLILSVEMDASDVDGAPSNRGTVSVIFSPSDDITDTAIKAKLRNAAITVLNQKQAL